MEHEEIHWENLVFKFVISQPSGRNLYRSACHILFKSGLQRVSIDQLHVKNEVFTSVLVSASLHRNSVENFTVLWCYRKICLKKQSPVVAGIIKLSL